MLKYRSFYEIDNPDKRLLKILGRGRGAFESLGSFYISCYGKLERVGGGGEGAGVRVVKTVDKTNLDQNIKTSCITVLLCFN